MKIRRTRSHSVGAENIHRYSMEKWRMILFLILTFAAGCKGRRRQGDSRHSPSMACNTSQRLPLGEACNVETNCKYGGTCRQVTSYRTGDGTFRLISPAHIRTPHHPFPENKGKKSETPSSLIDALDQASMSTECVCGLQCQSLLTAGSYVSPVCGTNGKTYTSECHLKEEACRCQTDISVKWRRPCKTGPSTIDILDTFADDESLSVSGDVLKESSGDGAGRCDSLCNFGAECDPDSEDEPCKCNIECKVRTLSYLCGTDGRTYTSKCQIRQAECRNQFHIQVQHSGPCTAEEKRVQRSRRHRFRPPNAQSGRAEFIQDRQLTTETTRHLHDPCQTLNCNGAEDDALCGSDGVSYPNECVMRVASCVNERTIQVKHKGFCQQQFQVPTTNVPSLIRVREEITIDTDFDEENDPCRDIYCLHDAVCIPHPKYEFICSCDDICDQEIPDVSTDLVVDETAERYLTAFLPSPAIFKATIEHVTQEIPVIINEIYKRKRKAQVGDIPAQASTDVLVIDLDAETEVRTAWEMEDNMGPTRSTGRRRKRRDGNSRNRRERGDYRIRRRLSKRDVGEMRPLIGETLCGTDGKSYKNECQMRRQGCHRKRRIGIAHRGACPMIIKKNPAQNALKENQEKPDDVSPQETSLPSTTSTTPSPGTPDEPTRAVGTGDSRKSRERGRRGRRRKRKNRGDLRGVGRGNESPSTLSTTEGHKAVDQRVGENDMDGDLELDSMRDDIEVREGNASQDMVKLLSERPTKPTIQTREGEVGENYLGNFDSEISVGGLENDEDADNDDHLKIYNADTLQLRDQIVGEKYLSSLMDNVNATRLQTLEENVGGKNSEVLDLSEKNKEPERPYSNSVNDLPTSSIEPRDEVVSDSWLESMWGGNETNKIGNVGNGMNDNNRKNDTKSNFTEGKNEQEKRTNDTQKDVIESKWSRPVPYSAITWGVGFGQLGVIALLVVIWVYFRRRKSKEETNDPPPETEPSESSETT